jgi:16S rRNA processing protein RimM
MAELKKIGHITASHGLKGEFKVFVLTNDTEAWFKPGETVSLIGEDQHEIKAKISSFYMVPKGIGLMKLEGYERIEDIQPLMKKDIYGEKKEFAGRVYFSDLIGCRVLNEEGKELGLISGFQEISGKIYLSVGERLLPYIPDAIVKAIDLPNKAITVTKDGQEALLNA